MNIITDRHLISALRSYVIKVPGAWWLYHLFWRIRIAIESRLIYKATLPTLKFSEDKEPSLEHPASQLCTASQMMTPLYRAWCRKLYSPARFSRKQWEFVYILQALYQSGILNEGKKGLGFGCGREPLAGMFASFGARVTATDVNPEKAKLSGWVDTMQHASNLDDLYSASKHIISKNAFFERVNFKEVDMNDISQSFYDQYDFVWSACALEHLGTLEHGLDFIKNSARCLKSGGIAVHTTEFNLSSNEKTLESKDCSIYRAKDINKLIADLEVMGYQVAPLNLNTGDKSVDRYVDLPPYRFSPHLKLELDKYVVTSVGLIIRRKANFDVV
jgi:2-polyprenyl-3-methyl-5-hydroxy-6-metoxy-1,4-benzoquinol methylase